MLINEQLATKEWHPLFHLPEGYRASLKYSTTETDSGIEVTTPQVIGSDWDGIKGQDLEHTASTQQLQKQLLLQSSKPKGSPITKKAMEIKVALVLVSALIAVAAAYPYKDQQQATAAAVNCNSNTIFRANIGRDVGLH